MNKNNTRNVAYEVVADTILAQLDRGEIPWRKPWNTAPGMRPQSVAGHVYTGVNALILGLAPYSDTRWLTYRKAVQLGGNVRRGESGTRIVFVKRLTIEQQDEQGDVTEREIGLLRYYTVFNVEQCEELDLPEIEQPKVFDAIEQAERIIRQMPNPPSVEHDGVDRAFYRPLTDGVHLPPKAAFESAPEYYSTAFHELGHSTGHPKRLARKDLDDIAPFGSEKYSREELVAEFTSAFLCAESGIVNATIENSAAYIQGWAYAINRDERLVVVAASQGQKAADYILGR